MFLYKVKVSRKLAAVLSPEFALSDSAFAENSLIAKEQQAPQFLHFVSLKASLISFSDFKISSLSVISRYRRFSSRVEKRTSALSIAVFDLKNIVR